MDHSQPSERAAPRASESPSRGRIGWELGIVLALSFGASAVYAVVAIIERSTRSESLTRQTATIARSLSDRPWFDLVYQLLSVATALVPVALVCWLVWDRRPPHLGALGIPSLRRGWPSAVGGGAALAACIGVPGLALYVVSRELGLNTTVVPTALDTHWWTVPVLLLTALRAAVSEELIVVGYLFLRLRQLGAAPWLTIALSALLRGSYHLYQGWGGAVGNVAMGIVFGWLYHRWGRVLPLVIAHLLLDIVSFVGYPLAVALWPQFFATS